MMSSEFEHSHLWTLDKQTLAEAQRFNRFLAWVPRLRIRNRYEPLLVQSLLRLSQLGNSHRLTKKGFGVQKHILNEGCLSVRILRPQGPIKGIVLDIHGGGWVIGNAPLNDRLNAAMAKACQLAVVSVEYRLAFQTPIQDIMNDCLDAARWLLSDGLPEYSDLPVILVGESAGAHLATATLLQLKAWPHLLQRVRGAILYYGVYDLSGTASVHQAGDDTLVLDGPGIVRAFRKLTPNLSEVERRQPPLSPLYGDLSGFPAALMFVGELDPLRDDTLQMAERWASSADVEASEVEAYLVPEAPHAFIHFPTRMAQQVREYSYGWIKKQIKL